MPNPHPQLTQVEWSAVAVALQDAGTCDCGPISDTPRTGPIARLWQLATGYRAPLPLSDARLEAIRRFVCVTRKRRKPAEELAGSLAEHGFSRAQIDAISLLSV